MVAKVAKTIKKKTVAEKRFDTFCSEENLRLAWDRINTDTGDLSYKNFYREIFTYYDYDIGVNLRQLSERLKNWTYKPSKAFRFYKPKESGLQRMFSLLNIEDMIVYQALANIVIPNFAARRKKFERRNVFSHLFCNNLNDNIFLFEKWKDGYSAYKHNIAKNFNNGLKYTAHFDLAAYYDTIDHKSLLNDLFRENEECGHKGIRSLLNDCLECWSNESDDDLKKHHHGIPQGPLSSSVFGEMFLLPIDEFLTKKKIFFSRYVDDFVIQGKTLEEVQRAVIQLEIRCKEKGLIPQVGKFEIIESSSVEAAIGKAPSLSCQEKDELFSTPEGVLSAFCTAFQKESFDSSRIRYILKVYHKTPILQDVIFREFRTHYEFVSEFCIYLGRFLSDRLDQIYSFVKQQIQHENPYENVEYELWSLLARICKIMQTQNEVDLAINRLKSCQTIAKLGIYSYLSVLDDNRFSAFLSHERNEMILLLAIQFISSDIVEKPSFDKLLSYCAKRSSETLKIVLSRRLYYMRLFREITQERLDECLLLLPSTEEHKYKTLNFYLKEVFGIKCKMNWEKFFGDAHQQACLLLYHVYLTEKTNKTFWLNCMDSFNDLLIRGFIEKLKADDWHLSLPCVYGKKGELVEYGSLLVLDSTFAKKNKSIVVPFREIHDRRCSTPLSHPRDKKTGIFSDFVSRPEAVELKKKEIIGLQEILKKLNESCKKKNGCLIIKKESRSLRPR